MYSLKSHCKLIKPLHSLYYLTLLTLLEVWHLIERRPGWQRVGASWQNQLDAYAALETAFYRSQSFARKGGVSFCIIIHSSCTFSEVVYSQAVSCTVLCAASMMRNVERVCTILCVYVCVHVCVWVLVCERVYVPTQVLHWGSHPHTPPPPVHMVPVHSLLV